MRTLGVVLAVVLAVGPASQAGDRVVPVASPYGIVQVQTQYHPGAATAAPVVATPAVPASAPAAPNVIYVPSQPIAGAACGPCGSPCATGCGNPCGRTCGAPCGSACASPSTSPCVLPTMSCQTMTVQGHRCQTGLGLNLFGRLGRDHPHFQKLRDWLSYCPSGNCRLCDHCTPHCQPRAYAWFLDKCYLCQHCGQPVVPGAACNACAPGGCGSRGCATGGCAAPAKAAPPCATGACGNPCAAPPCATGCGTPCNPCGHGGGLLGRIANR